MSNTLMKFVFGTEILEFESGAQYPARRPIEKFQIQDRAASGKLQVETLGITIKKRSLVFDEMELVDYEALLNWYDNIVNGGEFNFEFTDEKGFVGTVKITSDVYDLQETAFEIFSGVLELEYV